MRIYIITPGGNEVANMQAKRDWGLRMVLAELDSQRGKPHGRVRLLFGQKELRPGDTLKSIGCEHHSKLTLVTLPPVFFATGSFDRTLKFWRTGRSRKPLFTMPFDPPSKPVCIAFSADGQKMITAGLVGFSRIWCMRTAEPLHELPHGEDDAAVSAAFSPDGLLAVVGSENGHALIFSAATGKLLHELDGAHQGAVSSVFFSPKETKPLLATSSQEDKVCKVWHVDSKHCKLKIAKTDYRSGCFSPNGEHVVSARAVSRNVNIWKVSDGAEWRTFSEHLNAVWCAAFSEDGGLVISSSSDHTAKVWSVKTGECARTLEGHKDTVFRAVISRDALQAVTASVDRTARIWDLGTGDCLAVLRDHSAEVIAVAFLLEGVDTFLDAHAARRDEEEEEEEDDEDEDEEEEEEG